MNYRDFNPDYSCLPAEAYPYLAIALASSKRPRPSIWSRCRAAFARLCAALPVLLATAFLPLADPKTPPDLNSLVYYVDKEGKERPVVLPLIVEANPYSL